MEEVEAAEEDGVVLPSRVKLTREERRKARSRGGHLCKIASMPLLAQHRCWHSADVRLCLQARQFCRRPTGLKCDLPLVSAVERSCPAADDTELLPDNEVVRVEEALQQAEEDGIQLEPFNLAQVRDLRLKETQGPQSSAPHTRGHVCMGKSHV